MYALDDDDDDDDDAAMKCNLTFPDLTWIGISFSDTRVRRNDTGTGLGGWRYST